ncbi:putative holin-like toxin [Anaerobacillus sp. CMMVII]
MTTYQAFTLVAQFNSLLIAVLSLIITIVVYVNKKK